MIAGGGRLGAPSRRSEHLFYFGTLLSIFTNHWESWSCFDGGITMITIARRAPEVPGDGCRLIVAINHSSRVLVTSLTLLVDGL